jgi:hypothetical protein
LASISVRAASTSDTLPGRTMGKDAVIVTEAVWPELVVAAFAESMSLWAPTSPTAAVVNDSDVVTVT